MDADAPFQTPLCPHCWGPIPLSRPVLKWRETNMIAGGTEFEAHYNPWLKARIHTNPYGVVVKAGVWVNGERSFSEPFVPWDKKEEEVKCTLNLEQAKEWCIDAILSATTQEVSA